MPSEQSEDLFNIVSQSGYQPINYRTLVHKEIPVYITFAIKRGAGGVASDIGMSILIQL